MYLSIKPKSLFVFLISYHQVVWIVDGLLVTLHRPNQLWDQSKHFRVLLFSLPPALTVTRNSTGHVIQVTGVFLQILEWLSEDLNFRYSYLDDNPRGMEDGPATKGMMSYITERKADLVLGPIAMTAERNKRISFPYISSIGDFAILIPTPRPSTNVAAVWQPFTKRVWISLAVSLVLTILSLWGLVRMIINEGKCVDSFEGGDFIYLNAFDSLGKAFQYVTGVLLSQGGRIGDAYPTEDRKLVLRFLAGAWCVASFVIASAYCSVLISFLTSPNYKPLIESVYDLQNKPDVKLVVDKGWSPEILFLGAEEGIGKYLGDTLRMQPESRCSVSTECIERVRQGSSVYVMATMNILNIIGNDLKRNGQCDFTVAKELFWNTNVGFALAKDNPYMEGFRKSMIKMRESGLYEFWMSKSIVKDWRRCVQLQPFRGILKRPRLTLSGLSGAFLVLGIGLVISSLSFVAEKVSV